MKPIKPRSNNPESNTVHKVYVLGDSHLKHCVLELRSELSSRFQVTGVIKPGAKAEDIVNTSLNEIQNLGAHDAINSRATHYWVLQGKVIIAEPPIFGFWGI
jgi:hypothetical protein